jgi:large subunit ribosomal protein L10
LKNREALKGQGPPVEVVESAFAAAVSWGRKLRRLGDGINPEHPRPTRFRRALRKEETMERGKKEDVVAGLSRCFNEAQAVFVSDFKGIPMEVMTGLRVKMRAAGAEYQVAKNTLIKLAAKDTPVDRLAGLMTGNNALGYTYGDAAALAKVLSDFAKDNDKFVIKGGVLGDKVIDQAQIKALAGLPSREVLLAALLGTLNAVPTNFVRALAAVPQKLLYALTAIRDQKEAA